MRIQSRAEHHTYRHTLTVLIPDMMGIPLSTESATPHFAEMVSVWSGCVCSVPSVAASPSSTSSSQFVCRNIASIYSLKLINHAHQHFTSVMRDTIRRVHTDADIKFALIPGRLRPNLGKRLGDLSKTECKRERERRARINLNYIPHSSMRSVLSMLMLIAWCSTRECTWNLSARTAPNDLDAITIALENSK